MISLIAAIGKNNELGKDNELIWHLKKDLAYFKETTLNHQVVMGLNTYLSIGMPLPKRTNIVLTTHQELIHNENVIIYDSLDKLKNDLLNTPEEVFIIGGASLYQTFYPIADKMYLTEIEDSHEADVYFPKINDNEWNKQIIEELVENGIKYAFTIYERKVK